MPKTRSACGTVSPMHRAWTLGTSVLVLLTSLAVLVWIRTAMTPWTGPVTYQFDGKDPQTTTLPFSTHAEADHMTIDFPMILSRFQSRRLTLKPDDCLEELAINGVPVQDPSIPYCDYSRPGHEFNLSAYLRTGLNRWHLRIRDTGGDSGFVIMPLRHFWLQFTEFLIVALAGLFFWSLRTKIAYFRSLGPLFPLLTAGVALRTLYVVTTQYLLRGHDTEAHIDYIRFVAEHLMIPPAQAGWEFHQAPLYYMTMGVFLRLESMLGIPDVFAMNAIQYASLLFSVGVLIAACAMAIMLFPDEKKQLWQRMLFVGIVATCPANVFPASRITNEGMYLLFGSVAIIMMLRWWHTRNVADWLLLCAILALTALVKISGMAIVGAAGLCWLLRHGHKPSHWKFACMGALLFALIIGWYPVLRIDNPEDATKFLKLGNVGMNSGLEVSDSADHLLGFHPAGILRYPFNNPWGDEQRRQYFWEYFFRSAFFGEFGYDDALKPVARVMLGSAMFALLALALGFFDVLRKRDDDAFPMTMLFLCLLFAALWYRLSFPFSANQDFRQSVLVIFPAAYFIMRGTAMLRSSRRLRRLGSLSAASVILCCAASAVFIVLLYWYR